MEKVTGWTIQWVEFEDAEKATTAMASGEAEMIIADSSSLAKAFTRGLDAKLLWVIEDMDVSEALVVHNLFHFASDHGLGTIRTPRDLLGKRVGVYYGSSQHYMLIRFLQEYNLNYDETVDYQYGVQCDFVPCSFNFTDKVTIVSLRRGTQVVDEAPGTLWYAWERNEIHAAWVGFPHLYYFKQNGTVLQTNRDMNRWGYKTFSGLTMDWNWYQNPGDARYTPAKMLLFVKQILQEMAKSNFYYFNNTKEFEATHPVYKGVNRQQVQRVDGRIAGVIGGRYTLTWPHIASVKPLPVSEQVTCEWLGCQQNSSVAWALKDNAQMLLAVKDGWDVPDRGCETVLDDYSGFLLTYFIDIMLDVPDGGESFYYLLQGESVELGYHTEYVE